MRTPLAALALLLTLGLGGCTNASIAEAYGRPDPFEWSYFEGTPDEVVGALAQTFQQSGIGIESVRTDGDGVIVTLTSTYDGSRSQQIWIEATDVEGFTTRAQVYPYRDALPRWLEAQVTGRI